MACFKQLISYFCEYDLYDNMFCCALKKDTGIDVFTEQCNFSFLSKNMKQYKEGKIWNIVKNNLHTQTSDEQKRVRSYVNGNITLSELFEGFQFKKGMQSDNLKGKINDIQKEQTLFIYYPVFLNKQRKIQKPAVIFSCLLEEGRLKFNKLYTNKDILSLIIAQQKGLELSDVRSVYENQFNQVAAAIDTIHTTESFDQVYQLACAEFERIFKTDLRSFENTDMWIMLDKAVVVFEMPENIKESCFQDELHSLERFYEKDGILPETLERYIGLKQVKAKDIKDSNLLGFHMGSYQDKYPVNLRQWELVQAAAESKFLCVEGPPGTGKTTLLKEIIADTLVKKANVLLDVWDREWENPEEGDKGIYRSPLGSENLYSIIISSTNNKAIDNIGVELLTEIPFFNDVAASVSIKPGEACRGLLCARLGNSENINDFYKNIFEPFCRHLDSCEAEREKADNIKEHYVHVREELCNLNNQVSKLLDMQGKVGIFSSYSEVEEEKISLKLYIEKLDVEKQELSRCMKDCSEAQNKRKARIQDIDNGLQRHKKLKEELEERLYTLYSDLEQYEKLCGAGKFFIFLMPKAKSLKKKYGSAEQIRDMIQDVKKQQYSCSENEKVLEADLYRISEQESEDTRAFEKLGGNKKENEFKRMKAAEKNRALEEYKECICELSRRLGFSRDVTLKLKTYELRNASPIVKLRKDVFDSALRLFEAYICMHRKQIKNNLEMLLKKNTNGNGEYFSWCQALYNKDEPYPPQKAALVRALWETFFLCFPVVTTTLHSFRKSAFQMIPELFDMLMVDESGQIMPYYLAAPLYRMRRAVVVGDVNQIEPIKSVPPNMLGEKYREILGDKTYAAVCIDNASAQDYAVAASDYNEMVKDKVHGVILNEHRRCEKAIMFFSNQYIYNNVLKTVEHDDPNKLFGTNLAAFDIRGLKANQHYNQSEIDACKEIVGMLVEVYGADAAKEIGIVTPFKRQAEKIRLAIPSVEAGTAHVFQGAEKKYILFSSVIDDTPRSVGLTQFVGGKGNLLNVAFCRAKKQFIFVGNLQAAKSADNYLTKAVEAISQKGKIFSLFDIEGSGVTEDMDAIRILAGSQKGDVNDEIWNYLHETIPQGIISAPRLHNEILNRLLRMSSESISIISPWIGSNVVTEEMLVEMKRKIQNGVKICIKFGYRGTNCSLEDIERLVKNDMPRWNNASIKTISDLRDILGESLKYEPPSHVKLLLADDRFLFIGSLNWLFNGGKTKQKEISCLITNPNTIQYVKEKYLK